MMVPAVSLFCGIFGLFIPATLTFATTNLFRNGLESSQQRHLLSLITQASYVKGKLMNIWQLFGYSCYLTRLAI